MSATLEPPAAQPAAVPVETGMRSSQRGEPVWEIARFYPPQGQWTEADYFALPDTRFVELKNGCLEFLTMPRRLHQLFARFMFLALHNFVESRKLGEAHFTGLNVRLEEGHIRVPDICYLSPARLGDPREVQDLADLIVEVVSPSDRDRERDLVEKRADYALTGVREYWIIDPESESISVLTLPPGGGEYVEHGVFRIGQTATSVLLPGFHIDVDACFAAGKGGEKS